MIVNSFVRNGFQLCHLLINGLIEEIKQMWYIF